jgi:glycosyltransferase involved in cell wall biosynthesis
VILKQFYETPAGEPDSLVVEINAIKQWVRRGTIWRRLFRYREAHGLTYHLETLLKPLAFALLLRIFSHGGCLIRDRYGNSQPVSVGYILKLCKALVRDAWQQRQLLQQVARDLHQLLPPTGEPQKVALALAKQPVYLRTDLVFGLQSGGSIGHIAGVLNHLAEFGGKPLFLTTDVIPTVCKEIERVQIWPDGRFREFPNLQSLAFNDTFFIHARRYLHEKALSFIYQRYSVNNFAGLKLARTFRLPFVVEYNGSEVWVHRHWGKPLPHEALAEQIELANLRGAHVVVVVSQALKNELVTRGIDAAKILVNPNGVDPERYSPAVDGGEVRRRYGLVDKIVVGFIGTFGHWHGAEVLADAFGALLAQHPLYRSKVHLLLIGDGVRMPQVKEMLAKHGIAEQVTLAGVVPQTEGPRYLAACDILASPHVPNPDGSAFFGSPTKLFEYMAMGKGIVASDLAQIGEILRHNETAWLVKPGDVPALQQGLKVLIDDAALRSRLGENARQVVVSNYTWRAHTQRIIEKIGERCA